MREAPVDDDPGQPVAVADDDVDPPLWTIEQLAAFLQVPVNTVRKWRTSGYGPRGMQVGRYVRYQRSDVMRWLESR